MKLLSIETSRVTELFQAARPQGQLYLPKVAAELVERYSFAGAPQSLAELTGNRIEFSHGVFEDTAIEKLEIYSDGVAISAKSNSNLIEAFLEDLVMWLEHDLAMTRVKSRSVTRFYDSEIIVELDPRVLNVLEPLSNVSTAVSNMILENTGLEVDYSALGFAFSCEQVSMKGMTPSSFRIERRLASEFKLNQFVAQAPLKTDQHLELLETIETAFRQV